MGLEKSCIAIALIERLLMRRDGVVVCPCKIWVFLVVVGIVIAAASASSSGRSVGCIARRIGSARGATAVAGCSTGFGVGAAGGWIEYWCGGGGGVMLKICTNAREQLGDRSSRRVVRIVCEFSVFEPLDLRFELVLFRLVAGP